MSRALYKKGSLDASAGAVWGVLLIATIFFTPSAARATSLYDAIRANDGAAVDSLLRAGAMPDALLWHDGKPAGYPLSFAVQLGRYDIVRRLLGAGANPDLPPNPSPLRTAIERGDPDIVRILLVRGADREHRDRAGETPLFTAARRGSVPVASILLGFGADPSARADDGSSPLEAAIRAGNLPVAELLLKSRVPMDGRAARAALRAGQGDWPPAKAYFEREREEVARVACRQVVRSRSYAEVARFLRRDPDVPCRRALEARLNGFSRELVVEPRLVPWSSDARVRPVAGGGVAAEVPVDGPAALAAAEKATVGPLRVRHVHGVVEVRLGDFLLLEPHAAIPETDVRADATILEVAVARDGFLSAESKDAYGIWTLNGLALVPVGTEIRVDGETPVHLFGLDLLGTMRVTESGLLVEPGTTLYRLPW